MGKRSVVFRLFTKVSVSYIYVHYYMHVVFFVNTIMQYTGRRINPHMLTGVPTPMDTVHATVSTLYQLHAVSLDLSMTFDLHGLSGSPVGLSLLLVNYTSAE